MTSISTRYVKIPLQKGLGAWFNTRSASDVGGDEKNREFVNGSCLSLKKW